MPLFSCRASLIVSQLDFSFFTLPPGSYQVSDLKYKPLLLQYQREPASSLVWKRSQHFMVFFQSLETVSKTRVRTDHQLPSSARDWGN